MSVRANLKSCLVMAMFLIAMGGGVAAGQIIYVDADAPGANDGSSWTNAYNYLQDALADVNSGDEIRVAQGTYKPDANSAESNGSRDREATFQLINGVAIKGGYAGSGEPDPNERDIDAYETILSGDLDGNDMDVNDPCDLLTEPTRAENSYHVVTGSGTAVNAILNGFIITGGNANGYWPNSVGGGMYNNSGGPTVINCLFINNSADYGGGIANGLGSLVLTSCTLSGNMAGMRGGGMINGTEGEDVPMVTNCIFSGNSSYEDGGGISNHFEGNLTLINCTFVGNRASRGSAIFISGFPPIPNGSTAFESGGICKITNCIFWHHKFPLLDFSSVNTFSGSYSNVYDPCFADANNGDYHLKSQAGRWDANDGRWTKDEVTSPCIDAGDPSSPIGYEPFPNGGRVNMGAYGGTVEASKSYFGEPVCETVVAGDINGDCTVNFEDFAFMAFHWLKDGALFPPSRGAPPLPPPPPLPLPPGLGAGGGGGGPP